MIMQGIIAMLHVREDREQIDDDINSKEVPFQLQLAAPLLPDDAALWHSLAEPPPAQLAAVLELQLPETCTKQTQPQDLCAACSGLAADKLHFAAVCASSAAKQLEAAQLLQIKHTQPSTGACVLRNCIVSSQMR